MPRTQLMLLPALLLAFPWLNPLTYGPTHAVPQWLVTWGCAAMCHLCWVQCTVTKVERVRVIAIAWLMAALLSSVMGLLQYIGFADRLGTWVNYAELGQAFANLRQRNQLATLLAIGLAATIWMQTQCVDSDGLNFHMQQQTWSFVVGAVLLGAALAATGSRTGLCQLLLLMALSTHWKRGRMTLLLVVLTYAAAAYLLPKVVGIDPLSSAILGRIKDVSGTCFSRLTLWSNVLQLIAQKPWIGWGWGELDYAHFVTLYPGERFCEILGNAHNLPLHMAVELGLPFSLLVCGTLGRLVVRAKPWREQDSTRQMAWSVLAVIGLHSSLEYPLWYGPFQLAAVLAVWMLWSSRPHRKAEPDAVNTAVVRVKVQMAIALCMLAALSYAAWDYWRISQIYLPVSQRVPAYREDTLSKIQGSWLFHDQVQFAELGVTPLTRSNAEHIYELALSMLHFSPETMVVEKLIESASLLGNEDEVRFYMQRYQAAYPQDFARWSQANASRDHPKTP